jgi:hypothetical protein
MSYKLSFDPFGNLYLESEGKVHQVNISDKHIPYLEEGAFEPIKQYTTPIKKLELLDKENSLRSKIQKKMERQEDEEMYDSDDEYYLNDENEMDYYPEDNDYYHDESVSHEEEEDNNDIIDEDNVNAYGERNLEFKFLQNDVDKMEINYRENGNVMALYDTYIYENNKLIFNSRSSDNSSIYRFKITGNNIYCRLIGGVECKYTIKCVDNNIILC